MQGARGKGQGAKESETYARMLKWNKGWNAERTHKDRDVEHVGRTRRGNKNKRSKNNKI